jgi:hypothetical protein
MGIPDGVVGRTIDLNLVLGQSAKAAIWIPSSRNEIVPTDPNPLRTITVTFVPSS